MQKLLLTTRLLLLLMLLTFPFVGTFGQKMKVESFVKLSQAEDPDAKDPTFRRADTQASRRGLYCAIIKVISTVQDRAFTFDLGTDYVPEGPVEYKKNGEIWVYVPVGTNKIKISHRKYGQLDTRDGYYNFSTSGISKCEAATVYRLRLHTEYNADEDIIKDRNKLATVVFNVNPTDATILLRQIPETTDSVGTLHKQMPLGLFHYRVTAPDYHEYDGTFELTKEGEEKNVSIQLNIAYGWLSLDSSFDTSDCKFSVDGTSVEASSLSRMKLNSGRHTVTVERQRYRPQTIDVQIQDSAVFTLNPALQSVNGMLMVNTMPGATVKVDGTEIGRAPLDKPYELIIGTHTVEISCQNYRTETRSVTITEGQLNTLSVNMVDMAHFSFNSSPTGAQLYIDGEAKGITPCDFDFGSGNYNVKLTHKKYKDYEKMIHLDSSNPNQTFKLTRQYISKNCGYAMLNFQVGSLTGIGGTIGGYLYNINVEMSYIAGLAKSETVYWNNIGDGHSKPWETIYKPTYIGGKVGYGITLGTRMRITPQVGIGSVSISSTEGEASKTYAITASIGARFEYAVASCVGLSLAPEFGFAASKGGTYQALADLSSKIKGWAGGFNCGLGVFFFF